MKKIVISLALALMLTCLFATAIFATDYYLVQDGESELAANLEAEGKNVVCQADLLSNAESCFFDTVNDGDNIKFILAENLETKATSATDDPKTTECVKITKAITLTVEFGEYSWWFKESKQYGAFLVNNANATLRLIGTKAKDENGEIITLNKNDYNRDTVSNNIDAYSGFVFVYIATGKLYTNNLAVVSAEEPIYQRKSFYGRVELELLDSLFLSQSGYNSVAMMAEGSSNLDIKIDGGKYYGLELDNVKNNSYIKNATIEPKGGNNSNFAIYLDSWDARNVHEFIIENCAVNGMYHGEGDSNVLVAKNSTFKKLYLKGDSSGGAYATLTDSTYTEVDFSGNKGTGQLTIITSPTCEVAGTKTVYTKNSTVVDESYDSPAIGHKIENVTGVHYTNYFENGYYKGSCVVCNKEDVKEKDANAKALIINMGYSYNEENGVASVSQTFKLQSEMIKYLASDFEFGLIASINPTGAQVNPYAEANSIYAKIPDVYQRSTIKFSGIPTATNSDTMLVFCAVVIENGVVYYLDNGTTSTYAVGQNCNTVKTITGYDQE